MPSTFRVRAGESKFYKFDYGDFLESDEEISSQSITGEEGVMVSNAAITDDGRAVICKVTAGGTVKDCSVVCEVTTSTGQVDIAEMIFQVRG